MPARRFTDKEEKYISALYIRGMSGVRLCRRFGCSKPTIYDVLKRQETDIRDSRKYNFNQNYFECVDNEEKAYWLGYIMADGNVYNKNRNNTLQLVSIDEEHLYKFCESINYQGKLKRHNKAYKINACSKKLVNDLCKLGVVPKKTFCASTPNLDYALLKHFVRGVIDGDGSLGHYNNCWRITLVSGTESFLLGIKNIINTALDISGGYIQNSKNGKYFALVYNGNILVAKVSKFLYGKASVYLDRKYKKYLEVVGYGIK